MKQNDNQLEVPGGQPSSPREPIASMVRGQSSLQRKLLTLHICLVSAWDVDVVTKIKYYDGIPEVRRVV